MQLLVDCVNDSPEQIKLSIVYLQQVISLRQTTAEVQQATGLSKATLAEIVGENLSKKDVQNETAAPAPAPADKPVVVKTVTQEEVRQVMIAKQGEGKSVQLKALLAEYSATKISEIPLDKLAEFKAKVEAL
jgi:hypothetical protein